MLCLISAPVLMIYFIVLTGHSSVLMGVCSSHSTTISGVTHSSPEVCSPTSPWLWALPVVSVLGAAAGGIWTSLFLRHRTRSLDRAAPPLAPTIFR